ncbi:C-type lectin 37Db-like [Drosophila miranda]|uniref:C-type lectin 37Db-like n=1 Tax=Drosophila miranda TaxID=7229 RepID=UPI0007E6B3A9|nr:C-type lectin 37Db-like [Drosophila miranda]
MSKFASLLVSVLIVVHLQVSLASVSPEDASLSTQTTEKQCGGYCFNALKPILDHIAANQERWNACDARKLECTARLDRMEGQVALLQEKLSTIEAAIEAPGGKNMKNLDGFVQIGSRFFYIEQHHVVNWFSGTNICRQKGGHLASPKSGEEFSRLKEKLTKGRDYWLGISDLANEGVFQSQTTGNMAAFLKWGSGEPNNFANKEHCVELRSDSDFLMNDNVCTVTMYFVCEAGDDS